MANLNLNLDQADQSLQLRIADFKNDPEKMRQVNEFLNELFESAKTEAQSRQSKHKSHLMGHVELELGQVEPAHLPAPSPIEYLLPSATAQTL